MAEWSRIARRIRVPLGFVFAALYLWLAAPTWLSLTAGTVVLLPGLLLRTLASGHVRKNAVLTTTGPYAYTRNPLYLGSMIIGVGFTVASQSLWVLIALGVMFVLIYVPVVRSEEAYLRTNFPEYGDYARRVPRFLPRLRNPLGQEGEFSMELYCRHREYNAVLGTVAMVAALILKLVLKDAH